MKTSEKYALALAFAVIVLFFTAFAIGYSRYCYDRGFEDGVQSTLIIKELKPLSKYIK